MGQYPTGELFEYDGKEVEHLPGWPPRMTNVRGSAREAQTMAIYGGQLYVGVWPWGEVWRYHPVKKEWSFVRRMFSHPSPTTDTTHPYENECAALGGVANLWGQRVTGLVPYRDRMIVSTSAKGVMEWEPKYDFVGDDKWREYGATWQLYAPGQVSAKLDSTVGETTFEFVVTPKELRIKQGGKTLATAAPPNPYPVDSLSKSGTFRGDYGAFGAISDSCTSRAVRVTHTQ